MKAETAGDHKGRPYGVSIVSSKLISVTEDVPLHIFQFAAQRHHNYSFFIIHYSS